MKVQKEIGRRNRLHWVGFNLISILVMVVSLAFPLPAVQAQTIHESSMALSSPAKATFPDTKKPLTCSSGDHCALHFNGINQWLEEDQFRGFDTASFTLETWIKWTGKGQPIPEGNEYFGGVIPVIALGEDSVANASDLKLVFGINSSRGTLFTGFLAHLPESNQASEFHFLAGNTPITDGSWHHVATTFDGQILRLFLDGNLDAEFDLGEPVMPDLVAVRNVTIAAALPRLEGDSGFFKGALDEVRIWEIARTQPELVSAASLENVDDLNVIGYWMMNEGKGSEIKDSTGNGKHGIAQNDPEWSDGAPMLLSATPLAVNLPSADVAPNNPSVVSPADGSINVSTSPSLDVNASDPDGGNLTLTYYGKPAASSIPDFTFVVLPDTQLYSKTKNINGIFQLQAQWVVSQLSTRNIAFVGHLGDTVDDYNVATEWAVTDAAMKTLEAAGIPYGIGPGNCDEDNYGIPPGTTWFNKYFPVSRFAGRSYYGGAYNNDNANSYQLISTSGLNFIIIEIKYNVSYNTTEGQAILAWANNLLQIYSNRRAIIITHNLLTTTNLFSTDGSMVYNALKGNPNLFLMMGGHLDHEGMRTDLGTDGHTIYSLRSDYQTQPNGGNGWLRILRFSPDNNKIYITTYSPYLDQFETDADSQFFLDYNMGGTGYDVIGSATVPSGSTASVTWPNLNPQTQYQWYVTVNDGTSTTTGPVWSFTTTGGESAPVVTTQPVNLTVNAGQAATFTAAASGSPTPAVQWQLSTNSGTTWNDISGATSTTYSFTASSADNGKQYRAVFTNSLGSVSSNAATLTVNTPPAVITQPGSLTVTAGQTASFTAAASGNPSPTVQWQVSSDGGTTWANISGAISATYSFTTSASDNGKQFRAVFTNLAGTATTNAGTLTVQTQPVVTTQPSNQTVNAGQTVSFTAGASGNPVPTVQWQSSADGITWTNISGATSTTYGFTTSSGDNGRQFHAVFTNSVGTATSVAATLTVNTGPVITVNPVNLTVNSGQPASFTASASGLPSPTVQWQSSTNGTTWTNIPGATSTTYSFTTASADNGKQFRAVFTNSVGSETSTAAVLTVQTPPAVTTQPNDQAVNAGQTATFSSAASGFPAPTVQWQVSPNGSTWSDVSGATSTSLSFTAQAGDDGKQYRAVFTNAAGSATSNAAALTVYTQPVITLQPVSTTVVAGKSATFTAAASGNPTPTVQWQVSLDGTTWNNISGATATNYSFTPAADDNGKEVRAVFTNSVGSAVTAAAVLTVYYGPSVTTQPVNQSVIAGQTATFSAAATGNPAPAVHWEVSTDGLTWIDMTGEITKTLTFTAQITDNGKRYRAYFINAVSEVASNAAVLTVSAANVPPVVTLNPVNQTVIAGQTASFSAAASGTPSPTVQWQVSTNGTIWTDITGATSATYSFTALAGDNARQYRAVFTNAAGTATTTAATLTVYTIPVVTTQPGNMTVNAGQTATFTAAASGNPTPTVQWQASTDGSTWTNINGATSATYSLTPTSSDNAKQYRAVFSNTAGSATSDAATLTVNFAPAVTTQPSSQTVNAGQMVSLTSSASGNPTPSIQWQLSSDNGATWGNIAGATSTTYSFTAAGGDNGKQYRAVFTNSVASVNSNAAVLTVNTAPVITLHPSNVTVNAGQTASFTAAASGNPAPTVQWQMSTDGTTWSNITGAISTSYAYTTTSADDGMQYRAVFSNTAGSAATNAALLTVYTVPVITSQPVSLTVTAGQSVTFSADASGNPLPAVQWQLSTDNGSTWTNITGATSKTYGFATSAADNGKRYRAVFTNAAGSATTTSALLTVNTVPAITAHPSNLTVNEGQTATFTAAATGNPAPTVQWQSSPDGNTWTDITGATSATLSFAAQSADNAKQYRAVFTNLAGSAASNAATLTVQTFPVITAQPVNQTVTAGQVVTFTAGASGYPVPAAQWQVSANGTTWSNITGATSTTYSFTSQISDNGRYYRAVFTNVVGSATSSAAVLTVQYAPAVTTQPIALTVTAGQTAAFSADATGNPIPAVQWQLSTNNGATWTDINGATSTTYSFTSAAGDNGEQYRAIFTNSIGSAASNAAVLTVNFAPQVTTQPASQTVAAGQAATFTSLANGNPTPSIQWQVSTDGVTWTNISGATTTTYTFTAQAADNGKSYRAVFTNSIGTATSNSALLTVQNDLIFKDDFNTCNASAWNGGAVNSARLAFNTASGRNSTCGMGVTVQSSLLAYVVENIPSNETSFNARFYFMPNTLKMPNNTPITLFEANNAAGNQVIAVQLRWSGKTMQMRAGSLSDANVWKYTNWAVISNTWQSIEVDWNASSSASANNGSLTFWIDGIQVGVLSGLNNDVHSINSAYLGAVAGLNNKMSGSFFIDDYESHRLTMIGQ